MGSFLTGSPNTQNVIRYSSLPVSQSIIGKPIPVFWGTRRLATTPIDVEDWKSHKQSAKGKGAFGKGGTQYTYTCSPILLLGEGVIDAILNIFQNGSTTTTTTLSKLGLTFFSGTASQAPWSYMTTNHPANALAYSNSAYVAGSNFKLGSSTSIPDNAFECKRLNGFSDVLTTAGWTNPTTHVNTPGVDCSLADIIPDFLTSQQYGMGFGSGDIPDLTDFRAYQAAQGIYVSPLLDSQETANSILDRWAEIANTWIYCGPTKLVFVPLGDSAIGTVAAPVVVNINSVTNAGTTNTAAFAAGVTISGYSPTDVLEVTLPTGQTYVAWSPWGRPSPAGYHEGSVNIFRVYKDGSSTNYVDLGTGASGGYGPYDGYEAARAAFGTAFLTGASSYTFAIFDNPITDNTGGISASVRVAGTGYIPDVAAAYDLTLADTIGGFEVDRTDPADLDNHLAIEFADRTMGYASNLAPYKNDRLINRQGKKDSGSTRYDEICVPAVADTVAQLRGKRLTGIANTYTWSSAYTRVLLIPGSIVTLTDPNIGLNLKKVRITDVSEDDNEVLTFKAEEMPDRVATYAANTSTASPTPSTPDQQADPGNINTPAIVEPDASFTSALPVLLIAASGGPNCGSIDVYVGFNGVGANTYIGTIEQGAAQGTLTASLASHADPDTTNTLSVDCTESETEPQPVTTDDADALRTLALIAAQPTLSGGNYVLPDNGELLAFGDVTTTGSYTADLTYLRRGQLGTAPSAHSSGDQFTVIDASGAAGTTLRYELPPEYIGQPINFKFLAKNVYGNAQQDLSSVLQYQYTPTGLGYGTGAGGVPGKPTGLTASVLDGRVSLSWTANPSGDNVTNYKVYRAAGTGAAFGSATLIGSAGNATAYVDSSVTVGSSYTYFVVAVNAAGSSANSDGANATVASYSHIYAPVSATTGTTPSRQIVFNKSGASIVTRIT